MSKACYQTKVSIGQGRPYQCEACRFRAQRGRSGAASATTPGASAGAAHRARMMGPRPVAAGDDGKGVKSTNLPLDGQLMAEPGPLAFGVLAGVLDEEREAFFF